MSESVKLDDEEVKKNLHHYRNVLSYMGADVPIQVLCLPNVIENILLRDGYVRVYDLINRNLAEIKGLGDTRLRQLTSRLDEFFTVAI
jgi:hypothetical protein